MATHLHDNRKWIYIDDHNQQQGPFTTQKLLLWYHRHMLPDTLLVQCIEPIESQTNYGELQYLLFQPLCSSGGNNDKQIDNDTTNTSSASTLHWYYVGDDSKQHGPFTGDQMSEWYDAGYLKPTLRVRNEYITEYTPINQLSNQLFDNTTVIGNNQSIEFNDKLPNATEQPKHDKSDVSDDDYVLVEYNDLITESTEQLNDRHPHHWYYIDAQHTVHGPYHTDQMRYWYSQGWFNSNNIPLRHTSETKYKKLTQRKQLPSFTIVCENRWYYIDTQGIEQGPFTDAMMSTWYLAGYFHSMLPVRQVGETAFSKLGDISRSFIKK